MKITRFVPENVQADQSRRAQRCRDLSVKSAGEQDATVAVLAQWAADMNSVLVLLWERILIATPDVESTMKDIASVLTVTLLDPDITRDNPSGDTATEMVESARRRLTSIFDAKAGQVAMSRLGSVDHLDGLPAPTLADFAADADSRLNGLPAAQVITDRLTEARTEMDRATAADSIEAAWAAEWALFEAFLLAEADAAGDELLLSVTTRWALACEAAAAMPSLPDGVEQAAPVMRSTLRSCLGEIDALRMDLFAKDHGFAAQGAKR